MLDSDYNKWKDTAKIGSTASLHNKKIVSKPKGSTKASKSSAPVADSSKFFRVNVNKLAKERVKIEEFEERLAISQRDNIHAYFQGHLSPEKLNRFFNKGLRFGAGPETQTQTDTGNSKADDASLYDDADERILEELRGKRREVIDEARGRSEKIGHEMIDSIETTDLDTIHEILGKYDAVKLKDKALSIPDSKEQHEPAQKNPIIKHAAPQNNFKISLPCDDLVTTKVGAYKLRKAIEKDFISARWKHTTSLAPKADKLKKFQEFIAEELPNCPTPFSRIQLYSEVFSMIIEEFPTFGNLLAQIKSEYDRLLTAFYTDQQELDFLRTKVVKLVSVNENRLLLKYEKRKCKDLEDSVDDLKVENDRLRSDLIHKISIYAAYLPPSLYQAHAVKDEYLLASQPLDDPIDRFEKTIDFLKKSVSEKDNKIDGMRLDMSQNYVTKVENDKLMEGLDESQIKMSKLAARNTQLETELELKTIQLAKLEESLREKEEAYTFLITEYNELSEAVAVNFDKKLNDDNVELTDDKSGNDEMTGTGTGESIVNQVLTDLGLDMSLI